MKARFLSTRARVFATAALVAIVGSVAVVGVSAIARRGSVSEHWGVVPRNTIGSPVAELRTGPYVTGPAGSPPFGKGSLGIEVNNVPGFIEKVDFGNEVDFYGDPVLALNQVGFHVFQTQENVDAGGPGNMPNIRFEIDPNKAGGGDYTTMVWNPGPAPVVNRWSGYIDATIGKSWYFTGGTGVTTGCNQTTMCTLAEAKLALSDGAPDPIFFTVAVGKGRDNMWVGAVDGLRLNNDVYDFEATGVQVRRADHGGGDDD
jgi:hypothetical protein